MQAVDTEAGCRYIAANGMVVLIISKDAKGVVVKSEKTGNIITVPNNYPLTSKLEELVNPGGTPMEEVTAAKSVPQDQAQTPQAATPTATAEVVVKKERRGKKSLLIDEGLKEGLATKEIVAKVVTAFPNFPEKNIRNLVSVRRSKLKKLKA